MSIVRLLTGAAAAGALLLPAIVLAADPIPDMKGRWVGKTHTIIGGHGAHWPTAKGSMTEPALGEKDLVLEIKGQQDTRFWGVKTLSDGKERTEEPFIGVLSGKDYKKVVLADTDGYDWGELEGNTFHYCYAQAGPPVTIVSCSHVDRAK